MPSNTNNLIPMLSITGKPTKEDIIRIIDQFYDVGITNILLYPRDGLEIEYMSKEWFDTVDHFISQCEKRNMHIWLYDEFNWPSGSCKNTVQKFGSEHWLKCLRLGEFDTTKTDNIYNPDGNLLEIISKCSHSDLLNPSSVGIFINLTHEKYYEHFGKYFGNVITGIFTDEPSYIYTANEVENSIPYYTDMEFDYKKECGRDLFEDAKKANINVSSEFIKITNDLLGKRFREVYLKKIANWCKQHNIELTGHFLFEEKIEHNGNILKDMKMLTIPGIDDIYTNYNKRILQSYGLIQYGSKHTKKAMAELFALGPCNMSYDKIKRTIWFSAAFGITHYFLAIAHMNISGNYKKCNWFNACYDLQPNFEAMKLLCESASNAVKYATKKHKNEIALKYPRRSSLAVSKDNFDMFLDTIMDLSNMQVQWHIIDEDDVAEENFVFTFNGSIIEEKTNTKIKDLKSWVHDNIKPCLYVTENNKLASDLIVKVYDDNDMLVINTLNEERKLCVVYGDKKENITLHADGVFVLNESHPKISEEIAFKETFSFEQKTPGFYRVALSTENNTNTVYFDEDTEITIIARKFKEYCTIALDGKIIDTDIKCDMLHYSVSPLYKCSKKLKISKGEHKLSLLNDAPEKRYLPVLWIYGDFSVKENKITKKSSSDFYFGEGEYVTNVNIPDKSSIALYLKTNNIFCKLYINDEHIEDTVFTPQTIKIPQKYIGKNVKLTIKQFTSIAPIFGNVQEISEKLNLNAKSNLIINSVPEKCGFEEIKWVIVN